MTTPNKTDVFQLMSVRSPQSVESKKLRHFYIQDDYISPVDEKNYFKVPTRKLREIFSMNGESPIGRILYQKIFCENSSKEIKEKNDEIVQMVLETLEFKSVYCETSENAPPETLVNELEQYPYIYSDYKYYLLPTTLETINCEFNIEKLIAAQKLIEIHTAVFDKPVLLEGLRKLFEAKILTEIIYENEAYSGNFQQLKNELFERLYTLYILRRLTSVNLEYIIKGLQTLHTLEFLAVDDFLEAVSSGRVDTNDQNIADLIKFLPHIFSEFKDLDLTEIAENFSFIGDEGDLRRYFSATPAIHPIVAKLFWYKIPFNSIQPIGIGDLKVVKQWLTGYKVGEISHIHNIMKGEVKERNHRHLEKTEEIFSLSSENSSDTQRENQTTERFEVKKEAERVIKTDLNVGAHADFTYKNEAYGIVTNVGGNFAYSNSNQDTQKSASNYARDVMDKAVTQIQSRTTQNRSITKIFETEETNKHTFDNKQGTSHTSGIYRWLDKKYKAQLYNYGKRLMFEFIIPEPAAFYVEFKMRAVEFDIAIPQKPSPPKYQTVILANPTLPEYALFPDTINEANFNLLREKYDLAEFTYPKQNKVVLLVDKVSGKSLFSKYYEPAKDAQFVSDHFDSQIAEKGYVVEGLVLSGEARFWDQAGEANHWSEKNRFGFYVNGHQIDYKPITEQGGVGIELIRDLGRGYDLRQNKIDVQDGNISLDFEFRDVHYYSLSVLLSLELASDYLLSWQTQVYNKIKSIEQKRIDKINQELEIRYNAQLANYENALNELNAQTVNDIIQGRSEAFNRQIIRDELKKHCLTMIAKEFDSLDTNDILSNEDALEDKTVEIEYDRFFAGEVPVDRQTHVSYETVAGFIEIKKDVQYPKINIAIARKKARYIQFLEQAFEWENIAYLFYPYFWAVENKWIKLMNRLDYTDNNMTAFLKAGSVRILVAVTPAYNDAVLHFLATREPWEGGPLPVIGDPLFIPIYEEIRQQQQDDLQNAVAEGEAWDFEVPTSLVYLQDSSSPIPTDL
jgi:hypothetical protein